MSEATTIRRLPRGVQASVLAYFVARGLLPPSPPGRDLPHVLQLGGLCLADLVLCLLRLEQLAAVERLLGRPIHRCPPCVQRARAPLPARRCAALQRHPDDRVIVVLAQPQARRPDGRRALLGTPLYQRLAQLRSGITVRAALATGARREDFRIAQRRGYVELREAGA
jgi:hypothetical protein